MIAWQICNHLKSITYFVGGRTADLLSSPWLQSVSVGVFFFIFSHFIPLMFPHWHLVPPFFSTLVQVMSQGMKGQQTINSIAEFMSENRDAILWRFTDYLVNQYKVCIWWLGVLKNRKEKKYTFKATLFYVIPKIKKNKFHKMCVDIISRMWSKDIIKNAWSPEKLSA